VAEETGLMAGEIDVLRAKLWQRLKDEYALIAPAGSMATPKGGDGVLVGKPEQTHVRGRQRLPVGGVSDPRNSVAAMARPTTSGFASVNGAMQLALGAIPKAWDRRGITELWIDSAERMPIAAVPPQIRKSLYQPLTHRVGLYPLYERWYPIAKDANTRNDVRWKVTMPPKAGPGNTPRAVSMAPRYQFRKAWRVPRYSTNPDVAVPQSRNPGGGRA
jgi:hypothetical protein